MVVRIMPCCLSVIQAPIQAKLRPAMWLPFIRNLHSYQERWEIEDLTPNVCVQKVVDAIALLAEKEKIYLRKVDREKNFLEIFSYTKAEWLDVVEIEFRPGQTSGTEGFVLFFIPFYDDKFNKKRLERIKEAMTVHDSE